MIEVHPFIHLDMNDKNNIYRYCHLGIKGMIKYL